MVQTATRGVWIEKISAAMGQSCVRRGVGPRVNGKVVLPSLDYFREWLETFDDEALEIYAAVPRHVVEKEPLPGDSVFECVHRRDGRADDRERGAGGGVGGIGKPSRPVRLVPPLRAGKHCSREPEGWVLWFRPCGTCFDEMEVVLGTNPPQATAESSREEKLAEFAARRKMRDLFVERIGGLAVVEGTK